MYVMMSYTMDTYIKLPFLSTNRNTTDVLVVASRTLQLDKIHS